MAPLQLTEVDHGSTVTIAAGQPIELRLPENPTTGYRWQPPVDTEVTADDYCPDGAAVGAGGWRVFRFVVTSLPFEAGFELTRPWGGGALRTVRLRFIATA